MNPTWAELETIIPRTDVSLGLIDRFFLRLELPNCLHTVPFSTPSRPLDSHNILYSKNSVK